MYVVRSGTLSSQKKEDAIARKSEERRFIGAKCWGSREMLCFFNDSCVG